MSDQVCGMGALNRRTFKQDVALGVGFVDHSDNDCIGVGSPTSTAEFFLMHSLTKQLHFGLAD